MVGTNRFAIEGNGAGDAVALVQVGGGEDVAGANVGAGYGKAIEGIADDRFNRGVFDAGAERVVVVDAVALWVAVAGVLHFPGAGIATAGVEAIE